MTSPQEDAIGVTIEVTVVDAAGDPISLVGASVKKLIFTKPDGTEVEKDAAFVTDGSDGKIKYVTVAGDLSPYGTWQCQAYVVTASINSRGKVQVFDVLRNL